MRSVVKVCDRSGPVRSPKNNSDRVYPCEDCGTLRSKDEGGTTFTVCDKCWDKHFKKVR
jgi:DNA-directed RNA polymerase subunit M/transcription elongation factor TFIIS